MNFIQTATVNTNSAYSEYEDMVFRVYDPEEIGLMDIQLENKVKQNTWICDEKEISRIEECNKIINWRRLNEW